MAAAQREGLTASQRRIRILTRVSLRAAQQPFALAIRGKAASHVMAAAGYTGIATETTK